MMELKVSLLSYQKANNIELYQQLLDLGSQALELQSENAKLQQENVDIKKKLEVAGDIERYEGLVVTLKSDETKIKYCSHCWDSKEKLIQVSCYAGEFSCPHCHNQGVYDKEKYRAHRNSTPKFNVIGN